jgi:hypothetical protein
LTHFERRYEHRVERVLYAMMLAIPISGILAAMADGKEVVFFGTVELPSLISEDSDLDELTLGFHIAGHLAFFTGFSFTLAWSSSIRSSTGIDCFTECSSCQKKLRSVGRMKCDNEASHSLRLDWRASWPTRTKVARATRSLQPRT